MKSINKAILGMALGFAVIAGASAQSINSQSQTSANVSGQNQASNAGVELSNTWNTPSGSDVHEHISGITEIGRAHV